MMRCHKSKSSIVRPSFRQCIQEIFGAHARAKGALEFAGPAFLGLEYFCIILLFAQIEEALFEADGLEARHLPVATFDSLGNAHSRGRSSFSIDLNTRPDRLLHEVDFRVEGCRRQLVLRRGKEQARRLLATGRRLSCIVSLLASSFPSVLLFNSLSHLLDRLADATLSYDGIVGVPEALRRQRKQSVSTTDIFPFFVGDCSCGRHERILL